MSWLYLITSAFTLAKMLRDRYEADLMEARLQGRREAAQAHSQRELIERLGRVAFPFCSDFWGHSPGVSHC